jgi:hypothetical protein
MATQGTHEVELGEVRHGRDREADVVDLCSPPPEGRISGRFLTDASQDPKIVAGHDLWLHAEFVDERAEAER